MAKIMRKADIMILYKVRYGEKALLQSIHQSYTMKEYEEKISAYDSLFSVAPKSKKETLFGKLSDFEKEALNVDFPYESKYLLDDRSKE